MESSTIFSVNFTGAYTFATSSNVTIENIEINGLKSNGNSAMMVLSHSKLYARNFSFTQSNCTPFVTLSTEVYIYNITFHQIRDTNDLLSISRSPKSVITSLHINDCSTSTSRMIYISRCSNISISEISVTNYTKTFLFIKDSHIELISNVHISHYFRGIELINSQIELIDSSSFSSSGSETLLYSGAIYVESSNVTIRNTSFIQNSAVAGGAISSI